MMRARRMVRFRGWGAGSDAGAISDARYCSAADACLGFGVRNASSDAGAVSGAGYRFGC
ncbi:hypothetical protein NYE44_03010 [Paenibacillus sp. FSL L8-0493]|uniref:hypothetical protein n=2 Tax=Paenibacillus TaxID=44249 RepID=UPI001C4D0E37|nr:hypothetical protein [Paenibacillus odorifer]